MPMQRTLMPYCDCAAVLQTMLSSKLTGERWISFADDQQSAAEQVVNREKTRLEDTFPTKKKVSKKSDGML